VRSALRDHRDGKTSDIIDRRVPGLMIRVKPSDIRWSMRARLSGEQRRWDLGRVTEDSEDNDGRISINTARKWGMEIRELCRQGKDPTLIATYLKGGRDAAKAHEIAETEPTVRPSIDWDAAKSLFLSDVLRSLRGATHRDYRGKLSAREFSQRFEGRMVSTITDIEVAEAYAAIFSRAEPMGDGCLRVIKAFWSWLRDASRVNVTGVVIDLSKVRTLPRTRVEVGDPDRPFDPDNERGKAPPEIELGRALAIARSGALPNWAGYGLQLLLASAQRRRTVIGADRFRFKVFEEAPDEEVWFVPAYWRKSRKEGGRRSHLIPIVGWGASAVRQLDILCDSENSRGWLFPALKGERTGHQEVNGFNKILDALPGVHWSPHGVRYAFTDYGERDLGFSRPSSEAALILDHAEGVEPDNVTGRFYRSDPAIARKREMMRLWVDWLDGWATKAIQEDARYADRDWLRAEIFRARNGEQRLVARIVDRNAKGLPMWPTA
jgi:hypothetical protein